MTLLINQWLLQEHATFLLLKQTVFNTVDQYIRKGRS